MEDKETQKMKLKVLDLKHYTYESIMIAVEQFNKKNYENRLGMLLEDWNNPYIVDLNKVSHVTENVEVKADGVYANIQLLDTPCGNKIASQAGKIRSISSRGWGLNDKIVSMEGFDIVNGRNETEED